MNQLASKGSWSCIDLIIANRKSYFKNACVTVTGISDFHKRKAVNLKSQILKAPPKIQFYRNYKTFDENRLHEDLKSKLNSIEKLDYPLFESISSNVLNTYAPVTTKKVRANNHQFMTKAPKKLTQKTKSKYFRNLNTKDLNDNKTFWRKIKPFSSDKGLETNHIILKEKTNYSLIVLLLLIYSIIILSTLQLLWN